MLQNFCEFATDYTALLRKLKDPLNMRSVGQIIQFPFVQPVTEEKTEEELVRIAEKRKELGRKLQEMAATKRMEKVVETLAFFWGQLTMNIFSWYKKNLTCSILPISKTAEQKGTNESGWCVSFILQGLRLTCSSRTSSRERASRMRLV